LKNIFKVFRNYIEFVFFIILKNILGLFSFNFASNVGGILVSFFGKFTKYEQIIKNNLKVLNLNDEKSSRLTNENLKETGKVFFEFFNLNKFDWENISIENKDIFNEIKSHQGPKIFISAHIGNWELTRNFILRNGFTLHSVYRHANNEKIDNYIQKSRKNDNAFFYKKGSESAKSMIKALKQNEDLALLIDQRDSSGVKIDFFERKALATDGFANLAIKYKTMICPVYSIRNKNGTFQMIVEKPMHYDQYKNYDAKELVEIIHKKYFEKWILRSPSQWLWVHQRWKL
jgi:KDO2-lipid IV(A) lauroyltransferase